MKKENKKKSKKYKMSKRTRNILVILGIIVIGLGLFGIIYTNTEKYEKNKIEKLVAEWAEEYYKERLVNVASEYIKEKAQNDEVVEINLDALKNFGKNIEKIKNKKTDKQCDDINTYVSIKIDKNAKDISKDYKIENVVLDCFN